MKLGNRLIGATLGFVAAFALGLAAQTSEIKTKTKIEVKDGKDVTLTGCLDRNANGDYLLSDIAGGEERQYSLVTDEDLTKHVGKRVEVKGLAAGNGKGKVKIDQRVKTSGEKEKKATTEGNDVGAFPFLGVKSVKTLSDSCR